MAIRTDIQPIPLQPQARPTDTFVRAPQPTRPTHLFQLAEALGGLSADLDSITRSRKADMEREAAARGYADAFMGNPAGAAEGVRSGLIPAQESPAYMRAYKQGQGELAGVRLAEKFGLAFNLWEGRASGDQAAFDEFFSTFVKENVQTDDPWVLSQLGPALTQTYSAYSTKFINASSDAIKADALRTNEALTSKAIEAGAAVGVDLEDLWGTITEQRNRLIAAGHLPEDVDRGIIDTIINRAVALDKRELLGLLDKTVPGEDYTYAQTTYGGAQKNEIERSFDDLQRRMEADAERARKAHEEARKNELTASAQEQLAKDPSRAFSEEFLREGSKYDPTFRTRVLGWQKTFLEDTRAEEPDDIIAVQRQIMDGGGAAAITRALNNGVIRSPETLASLSAFARAHEEGKTLGDKMLTGAAGVDYIDSIKSQTQAIIGTMLPGGWSPDGLKAATDFRVAVYQWAAANPNATFVEQQRAMEEIYGSVFSRIEREGMLSGARYDRPTAPEEAPNAEAAPVPEGPAAQAPGEPPVEEAAPASPQAPASGGDDLQDYRQWLDELHPETRETIDQLIETGGYDREEFYREVYEEIRSREAGEAPAPTTTPPTTGEEGSDELGGSAGDDELFSGISRAIDSAFAGGGSFRPLQEGESVVEWLTATTGMDFSSPDASEGVRGLLDTIASVEAPGGYNQRFGEAAGSPRHDLVNMTINEVLALPANRAGGFTSSANGKYQILDDTLRSLVSEMGLTGEEKFDAAMQDRMASQLLRRRGLDRFLAGEMSAQDFMNSLAQEWAGLPTTSGGSYYQGQKAGLTVATMLGALRSMREGGGGVGGSEISPAYANIPDVDGGGQAGQREKFMRWNSDPVGNHEQRLASVEPRLQGVIKRAQELAAADGFRFVVGSGKRTDADQQMAVDLGWSRTRDSRHEHGEAADLWVVDESGAVTFSKAQYDTLAKYMRRAAREAGVEITWGGNWKRKDIPHFELRRQVASKAQ